MGFARLVVFQFGEGANNPGGARHFEATRGPSIFFFFVEGRRERIGVEGGGELTEE
jgi:hypothetical protein